MKRKKSALVWKTTGREYRPEEMGDAHLVNVLHLQQRRVAEYLGRDADPVECFEELMRESPIGAAMWVEVKRRGLSFDPAAWKEARVDATPDPPPYEEVPPWYRSRFDRNGRSGGS